MTDWEEKMRQLVYGLAGLYHRQEHLILNGQTESAKMLKEQIDILVEDIKLWLEKKYD